MDGDEGKLAQIDTAASLVASEGHVKVKLTHGVHDLLGQFLLAAG